MPRLCIIPWRSNHGKTSVRVAEKCLADQRWGHIHYVELAIVLRATSSGLLILVTAGDKWMCYDIANGMRGDWFSEKVKESIKLQL